MTYTPRAGEVFDNKSNLEKLAEFAGKGALALRISKGKDEALVTLGIVQYRLEYQTGDVLATKDFSYRPVLTVNRDSFNGVASREMLEAEILSLGEHSQYFEVIEYDGAEHRSVLVQRAETNLALKKTDGKIEFEIVNPVST